MMRSAAIVIGILCALVAPSVTLFAAQGTAPFDKPVKVDVVALPKDQLNPDAKPKITCSRFPGFMVKEIDLGEVGAEKLALLAADAPCERTTETERVIADDTAGYFMGVSGGYVFFRAADGWNGGLPFVVYEAKTGERLLNDSLQGDNPAAIHNDGGKLVIDFRRVLSGDCSLYKGKDACEKAAIAETGLPAQRLPDCAASYKAEIKRTPDRAKDIEALPSVITYPVELTYDDGEVTRKPTDGPVTCSLPD